MFGRTIYPPYICITELVINPTEVSDKIVNLLTNAEKEINN